MLYILIKGRSSVWMKENGIHKFAWQGGYAAFSVSESIIEATKKYILNQEKTMRNSPLQKRLLIFVNYIK